MKVAIIGAGISGLSCAHEFQRLGVKPTIYEKNDYIGEMHPHVAAILSILHRPMKDSLSYFRADFGLDITPLNTLNTLVHYSESKITTIKGNFGYFFERSKEKKSVKKQLYSQLEKPRIIFNELADYEKLSKKYDYVIVGSGNSNFTQEKGCWYDWVTTHVKGATVLGEFDPNTLIMWINKGYCNNGYAYLTPFNSKRASLILVVTDIAEKQVDFYWDKFLYYEDIKWKVVEEFRLKHNTGYVYPNKIDNLCFVGNAGGGIDPFLGFGMMNSLISGAMAARSIVKGYDYNKLTKFINKQNLDMYEFRRSFNKLNNRGHNMILTSIGLPGIKKIMYYSNLNVIKTGGKILGRINRLDENKRRKRY
ncbi:MAG: NAD(P)-binding protein [Maledivibacter sp.]|nr:NAD(P)-binding protein [Maledivibacter sp.]